MGNTQQQRLEGQPGNEHGGDQPGREPARETGSASSPGHLGCWAAFDLVSCTDGKARRVEPGSFPLAHGIPARVGRLRGYGNAIVPQVAAEFIRATEEAFAAINAGVT